MAYNSTIKRKKCKCGCSKFPTLGYNGYAMSCAPQDVKDRVGSKKKVAARNQAARNKVRMLLPKDKSNNMQELWFAKIIAEIRQNPYCWETGDKIPDSYFDYNKGEQVKTDRFYRAACCHIFPKSIFLSIATHPLNYLVLSASNGSHDKTHRLDTFCKMGVWKEAVDRFKQFEPYITENHKYLNTFRELVYGKSEE